MTAALLHTLINATPIPATNLATNLGRPDEKICIAPKHIPPEIQRALVTLAAAHGEFPNVLAGGIRTRWTAHTIQRDPSTGPAMR